MSKKYLVLIIENNAASHNLTAILKQAGYAVSSVNDCEDAIETIRRQNPVLLICNNASGAPDAAADICRKIRCAPELDLPPVCLIGEERSPSNRIHLKLETEADEYIATPFEPLKFIKTITSLIEQKRTRDSLEHKDVIFRSLIENITDIITVIAPDGAILYESPSVEFVLGRKPVDTLGVNAFDFVHPDDRQKVSDYFHGASREEAAEGVATATARGAFFIRSADTTKAFSKLKLFSSHRAT